ncbi:hypothetical protein MHAS44199_16195 [Mycolicibacterium hassiacum DSM 44199]|nr:hypothetical protein [Mycolicibacterium hassiacum DSM 44199]
MTGSPRTSITPTPRGGNTAPCSSMTRTSIPDSGRPSLASRRLRPRLTGTARRSNASRSASTSSTRMPAPHSENDTATVVSAIP